MAVDLMDYGKCTCSCSIALLHLYTQRTFQCCFVCSLCTCGTCSICFIFVLVLSVKISNFLIVPVALIALVLYFKKIILLKICTLYYLVLLNSFLFLTWFVTIYRLRLKVWGVLFSCMHMLLIEAKMKTVHLVKGRACFI